MYRKVFTYSLVLFILLFLNCCESKDVPGEPDSTDPEVVTCNGFTGQNFYYYVKNETNDDLVVESNDPEIAIGEIEDHDWIRVQTKKEGVTYIRLRNSTRTLMIFHVAAYHFGSEDIEEIANHPTLKNEVFVEAADADVKAFIENELWEYANLRKKTKYIFNPADRTFQMNIIQLDELYNGTYEWSIDSLILKYCLKYNGVQEKYGFNIESGNCYVIKEDKTEEYQRLFPSSGITDVRLNRIWYDHCIIHLGGLDI